LIAARDGLFSPIVTDAQKGGYADPVPQAVILTAIVIGLSIQALMLVGVMKLSRDNPTLEIHKIERRNTP
jgi:multicomponent Na+:H+ antiporter subunit C